MANRFRKLPQAEADLDLIWSYIAAESVLAANRLMDRIGDVFEMLTDNPFAGRQRSELRTSLRSFAAGNYVIFYLPLADGVEVVRVMHGRQDIDPVDMI
ncbi:MAG: type II toxin-antitoxin system RelE/ParE family toxin [Bradyrhizobium sp.]|uniref:type II toxin-antitoxin system RelE/ParE family toxin n=1 Tax=Bradyrhizobium sp. TaxID=376 RepID=UPI001DE39DBB|nr:type II toxin-antitoxin system RelE/ParE family toxin [Bradyrhizobium sp.]MBV9559279.1 type II toxin-antitoxin system RelE/ParE family toxin [Bradyrhizobium sp.]